MTDLDAIREAASASFSRLEGRWKSLDRAVFRISGPDRVRYLNGQVTNDVSKLDVRKGLAACLCGIKGKVEALVWIQAGDDHLLLDGELGQREQLHARLERYLIADDCEVEDVTGKKKLVHHFRDLPGPLVRRLGRPGRDLWITETTPALPADTEIPADEWDLLQTLSLVPRSGEEITAAEFPSELGLDDWAVDYHKGCYLGQEIVSRLRSVGRVKRGLALIASPVPLAAHSAVRTPEFREGTTTRASRMLSEKIHLSLALLGAAGQNAKPSEAQVVEEFSVAESKF